MACQIICHSGNGTLTKYYEALLVFPWCSQGWPRVQLCCPEERPPLSFFSLPLGLQVPGPPPQAPCPLPPALSRESTMLCTWEGEEQRGNWQRCKTSAVLASESNPRTVGSWENLAPNPTHTTWWRYPKDLIFGRITTQWYRDAFFQYSKRFRWFLSLLQNTCRWGVSGKDKEALTSLDEALGTFLLQCRGCKLSSCLQVKTEGCWDAKKD